MIKINNKDEFTFKAMVMACDQDAKQRLCVNYTCNKDDMSITLEGYAKDGDDSMNAVEKITFANFKRRFKHYRVYLSGYYAL